MRETAHHIPLLRRPFFISHSRDEHYLNVELVQPLNSLSRIFTYLPCTYISISVIFTNVNFGNVEKNGDWSLKIVSAAIHMYEFGKCLLSKKHKFAVETLSIFVYEINPNRLNTDSTSICLNTVDLEASFHFATYVYLILLVPKHMYVWLYFPKNRNCGLS